jgi:DNA repair exonuclease SbcCD ATPase subunit
MFKSELSSAIRKIRQDFERENDLQRNELYGQFTQAYEDIAREYPDLGHLFLSEREQERIKQEEDRIRTDIQRIKTDSNLLKQKNGELKLRTRELQINLEMSLEENIRFEQLQQNEINQLKSKQERISKDYEDVITKQTSLEKEIETYRNLLEGTMKTVVDTITDDYNSTTANQQQQQNGTSQRMPRSASVDRNSSSSYLSTSRLNGHTNSYSRFTTQKQNGYESTNTSPVIEIPTINENGGLATSKSVGDLSVKNGLHSAEVNGISNGSSPPHTRPPPILQTRRS